MIVADRNSQSVNQRYYYLSTIVPPFYGMLLKSVGIGVFRDYIMCKTRKMRRKTVINWRMLFGREGKTTRRGTGDGRRKDEVGGKG